MQYDCYPNYQLIPFFSFGTYLNLIGTALAVAGKGYAIIAADRRLSQGYSIQTRESTKIIQLTDQAVLASCGMQADRNTLHSVLKARMQMYQLDHEKDMSVRAISQMLSRTLYYRRFFPYCKNFIFLYYIHYVYYILCIMYYVLSIVHHM